MRSVENVRAPIAECAIAEINPRAPFAVNVTVVVGVLLCGREPDIPVEGRRDGLFWQKAAYLHAVPTALAVHVGRDFGDVLDDARLSPRLELKIICLGLSLVTHLRSDFIFFLRRHHQLDLTETMSHRLFAINVFTQ